MSQQSTCLVLIYTLLGGGERFIDKDRLTCGKELRKSTIRRLTSSPLTVLAPRTDSRTWPFMDPHVSTVRILLTSQLEHKFQRYLFHSTTVGKYVSMTYSSYLLTDECPQQTIKKQYHPMLWRHSYSNTTLGIDNLCPCPVL